MQVRLKKAAMVDKVSAILLLGAQSFMAQVVVELQMVEHRAQRMEQSP
jgi:hypothetical protein